MVIVVSDALRMMKDSAMRLTLSRQKKMSDSEGEWKKLFYRKYNFRVCKPVISLGHKLQVVSVIDCFIHT